MPLSQRLTTTQQTEMIIVHMIGYIKIFSKPLALAVAALGLAWFNDFILLQIEEVANIEFVMPIAKAISSILALTLSGLGGFYAHSKWRGTKNQEYKRTGRRWRWGNTSKL